MSLVMFVGVASTLVSLVGVPVYLYGFAERKPQFLATIIKLLLLVAGVICGFMSLIALAAAAWGMDTRVPWGLGVYMYLVPAMSMPSFLSLRFISVQSLSRLFWFLTIACALAWYFGDQAERAMSKFPARTNSTEIVGVLFNAFTMIFFVVSVLIQLAAACKQKQNRIQALPVE